VGIGFSKRWLVRLGLCTLLVSVAGCLVETPETQTQTLPANRAEAWRFLSHATFGPTEAEIERVTAIGYEAWLDEQFSMPLQISYHDFLETRNAELKASDATAIPRAERIVEAIYTRALTDPAQLRQRVVFALSEIFVVSIGSPALFERPALAAGYLDTLDTYGLVDYRNLLDAVTKSPAMGVFLTYRSNLKEDPVLGRIPDENYAREVMQLFSIGLHELNLDGSVVLAANGQPKETYTGKDVRGLAKIFTGWSYYRGPSFASQSEASCFLVEKSCSDPEAAYHPMIPYATYHSTSATEFLGVSLAERESSDPEVDLKIALDTLSSHKNVAPFFSKQLIQRLVTSNPSPAYVARVAQTFLDTNGSIKDVVKAILMDKEAMGSPLQAADTDGKVREPVLRLTALLRAFQFDGPGLNVGPQRVKTVGILSTGDPTTSFGQSPLYAPSVFNFFRPGYVPPQSQSAARGLVAPEMQITSEISVVGYVNSLRTLLADGIGQYGNQTGLHFVLTKQRPLAQSADQLTEEMSQRLLGGTMSDALRQDIAQALETMPVPALDGSGSNAAAVNNALDLRINAAILMTAVSPEFLIQK
jgi:uncharacterized protein (DUF1800 family)